MIVCPYGHLEYVPRNIDGTPYGIALPIHVCVVVFALV